MNTWWVQVVFVVAIVMVVTMNLSWVGILIINSLLILPAAAARNLAENTRQYVVFAVVIALVSGVCGLLLSYYSDTASGATIVLVAMGVYFLTLVVKTLRHSVA